MNGSGAWPALPYAAWKDTRQTLHLWTQIAGKIRLKLAEPANHWWHVPLYVTSRGLTTSPMRHGARSFELIFDFLDHQLRVVCSDGAHRDVPLRPLSTAAFYGEVMEALRELGLEVRIYTTPSELPGWAPFEQDETHGAYDPDAAQTFWRALLQIQHVFSTFRGGFVGKVSPVHFFWGSFDLAVTRFSGRTAPPHPGAPILPDWVMREAYSHEVSSAGFWPGGDGAEEATFYAYAYPSPEGFDAIPVRPEQARFEPALGEFVLPYEAVRTAPSPERALLEFLESTYAAAADLAAWDRAALERPGQPQAN
jgi:hypothetical protein